MKQWKPQDVIAVIIIAACLYMVIQGYNGTIKVTLLAVVGLYYGIDLTPFIKLGRIQKKPKEDKDDGTGVQSTKD